MGKKSLREGDRFCPCVCSHISYLLQEENLKLVKLKGLKSPECSLAGGVTVLACNGVNLLVPIQEQSPGTCSAFSSITAEASGPCSAEADLTDSFALFGLVFFPFYFFFFFMLGRGTLSRWQSIKNNKTPNLAAVIHHSPLVPSECRRDVSNVNNFVITGWVFKAAWFVSKAFKLSFVPRSQSKLQAAS